MILSLGANLYLQMRIIIIKVTDMAVNEVNAMSEHCMAGNPRPADVTPVAVSYTNKGHSGDTIEADRSLRCALSETLVVGLIRAGVLCAEDLRCLDQSSGQRLKCLVLRSCVASRPKG